MGSTNLDNIKTWRQDHHDMLCRGLTSQLASEQYTDVHVVVGDKTFKCHRVVLAAMSPYFDAMFTSGMRESVENIVKLQNVDVDIFEKILQFVYGGQDIADVDVVGELLQASAMLQINGLVEYCERFMLDKIDKDNCLGTWKIALMHGCTFLAQTAFRCVLASFKDIWMSDDFLALDKNEVMYAITDNDLNTTNEEEVCECVFRWINHDTEHRAQYISELVENLRLPLMQPEYILEVFERNKVVQENERCRAVVEEAKRYHLLPARRQEFVSPRLVYRNSGEFEEVLVCIGGEDEDGSTSKQVTCCSFRTWIWYELAPLPFNPGVEFATCGHGNAIFISGGSARMNSMISFISTTNRWEACQPMLLGRRRHVMAAVGDSIYVLGGYDDEAEDEFRTLLSVEEFQMSAGCWEDVGYLSISVRSASAAVDRECIYIFGGVTNTDCDTKYIQCFNTRQRSCTVLCELPTFCRLSMAISYRHKMYLVVPSGEVLEFDGEKQHVQTSGTLPNFKRYSFGLLLRHDLILILGGRDESSCHYDDIRTFDLTTNIAGIGSELLPSGMYGFGCAKAVIHRKYLRHIIT